MWERELHGPVFISALEESSEIDGSPTGRGLYGMDSGKPLAQVRNHKYPQTECWKNFTKDKQVSILTYLVGQSTEGRNKTSFESKTFFFPFLLSSPLPLNLRVWEKVIEKQRQRQLVGEGKTISFRMKIKEITHIYDWTF